MWGTRKGIQIQGGPKCVMWGTRKAIQIQRGKNNYVGDQKRNMDVEGILYRLYEGQRYFGDEMCYVGDQKSNIDTEGGQNVLCGGLEKEYRYRGAKIIMLGTRK